MLLDTTILFMKDPKLSPMYSCSNDVMVSVGQRLGFKFLPETPSGVFGLLFYHLQLYEMDACAVHFKWWDQAMREGAGWCSETKKMTLLAFCPSGLPSELPSCSSLSSKFHCLFALLHLISLSLNIFPLLLICPVPLGSPICAYSFSSSTFTWWNLTEFWLRILV